MFTITINNNTFAIPASKIDQRYKLATNMDNINVNDIFVTDGDIAVVFWLIGWSENFPTERGNTNHVLLLLNRLKILALACKEYYIRRFLSMTNRHHAEGLFGRDLSGMPRFLNTASVDFAIKSGHKVVDILPYIKNNVLLDVHGENYSSFSDAPLKIKHNTNFHGSTFTYLTPTETNRWVPHNGMQPEIATENLANIRFNQFTEGLLRCITWDNVVAAGSSSSTALNANCKPFSKSSDIDLFVYGKNQSSTVNRLLTELGANHNIVIFKSKCLVTIIVRNYKRNIQIVATGSKDLASVVSRSDLPTSRSAYTGKKFVSTSDFLLAFASRTVWPLLAEYKDPVRLTKCLRMGFNVLSDIPLDDINMTRSDNKYVLATDESPERLEYLMKTIVSEKYTLVPDGTYVKLDNRRSLLSGDN